MNKPITFRGPLAQAMDEFVAGKRMQGYDYTDQARTLSYFDRFLAADGCQDDAGRLTLDTFQRYVATTAKLAACSRQTRIASLREFSRWLQARGPGSAILPLGILPRYPRQMRFFPITPEQVAALMAAAPTVLPANGMRSRSFATLIGLLYSTGLRLGEALNLTPREIAADGSTVHVVKGKFGKERLVPLSPSASAALTDYLAVRRQYANRFDTSPLFIKVSGAALSRRQVRSDFHRLCRHCGLWGGASRRRACTIYATTTPAAGSLSGVRPVWTSTPCCPSWPPPWGMSTTSPPNATCTSTRPPSRTPPSSLTVAEVDAILAVPDTGRLLGARDKALLQLLHNSGARVQEVADLNLADLRRDACATVKLTGKGRKTRVIPLWPQTLEAIDHYLTVRQRAGVKSDHLFVNVKAQQMTRFGIGRRVEKLAREAARTCPSLCDRTVTPHVFRHTTAMHLIEAGNDIAVVKDWLGHADLKTTHAYLEVSIKRKRDALAKLPPPAGGEPAEQPQWKQPKLMAFLSKLSPGVMLPNAGSEPQSQSTAMT